MNLTIVTGWFIIYIFKPWNGKGNKCSHRAHETISECLKEPTKTTTKTRTNYRIRPRTQCMIQGVSAHCNSRQEHQNGWLQNKFVPMYNMKPLGGGDCADTTAPILDLGPRWRWVVSYTPRSLFPQGEKVPGAHQIEGWVDPKAPL